ncbi:hypothetical protein WN51_07115 [Melipona quadrifasciata]|uniref:Uncharacterized protein n=1 Tax=Melipona quadrifasciata TaxID=166423 RepID=A0A0N0BBW4_9HYME|nr:hypothetical protein WN51_07115 [Melipona quadrifasciata]
MTRILRRVYWQVCLLRGMFIERFEAVRNVNFHRTGAESTCEDSRQYDDGKPTPRYAATPYRLWDADSYPRNKAMDDIKGVKTVLKVGGAKYILSNISEMIKNTIFVQCIFGDSNDTILCRRKHMKACVPYLKFTPTASNKANRFSTKYSNSVTSACSPPLPAAASQLQVPRKEFPRA